MPGLSGVGISFGADRIYDVLNQLNLYPEEVTTATQVLFINFGEKETDYSLPIIANLREQGIRCEIYPEASKMKKQMQYANQKGIPFVIMTGETEMAEGKVMLKNMTTGEQNLVSPEELINALN
jgi:histidyl-tRNA synthetase